MVCSSSAHSGPRPPAAVCWLQRAPSSAIRQSPRSTFDMDSDIRKRSPLQMMDVMGTMAP